MKRFLFAIVGCLAFGQTLLAQDVIVRTDGSTILCKVYKIGITDVEYRKLSNLTGPLYTMLQSEIFSINYENGDRDIFTQPSQSTSPKNETHAVTLIPVPQQPDTLSARPAVPVSNPEPVTEPAADTLAFLPGMSQESVNHNAELVRHYNSYISTYKSDKTFNGTAERMYFAFAIDEQSVLLTDDLQMDVTFGHVNLPSPSNPLSVASFSKSYPKASGTTFYNNQAIQITLQNLSERDLYVDLSRSFISRADSVLPLSAVEVEKPSPLELASTLETDSVTFDTLKVVSGEPEPVSPLLLIPAGNAVSLAPEMLFPKDLDVFEGIELRYSTSRNGYYPVTFVGRGRTLRNGQHFTFKSDNSPVSFVMHIAYTEGLDKPLAGELNQRIYVRDVIAFPQSTSSTPDGANPDKFIDGFSVPYFFVSSIQSGSGDTGHMYLQPDK